MDLTSILFVLLLQIITFCHAQSGWEQTVNNEHSMDPYGKETITDTILKMNKGALQRLMEGDLLLPTTRTAMKCVGDPHSCLWQKSPNGNVVIPVAISDNYDASEKSTIVTALQEMEAQTCIRFIPRTTQRVHISIEPKYGCFSMLGRLGDKQVVSLQRFGCVQHGIILHEMMHALGFYHEHTRSDRDNYVRIEWENVQKLHRHNFQKQDTNNLNIPYDYTSLLHYGRTAFGKGQGETIIPIPDESVEIGQRNRLSDLDVLRINRLYQCKNYRH
ncbi:low choriolytic enzyme-like isoform X2 [Dunckerocampus dactyliophorus]|uniref:low choriolytic enzyme-like isoform X2 n=1 Tax=Dunckerocampus dactyliophorus TaxID=161453 RepID=UPI002406D949|nr:low choriolytic enzyme-like isoform X2 [Dunckerocampus dactyliophorus]